MAGGLSPIGFGAPAPQGFGGGADAGVGLIAFRVAALNDKEVLCNGAAFKPSGSFPLPLRPVNPGLSLRTSGLVSAPNCYAFGNGTHVAFAGSYVAYSDAQGLSWAQKSLSIVSGFTIYSVIFDGAQFLAVGAANNGTSGGVLIYSSNGIDWSLVTLTGGMPSCGLYKIVYANGTYVAIGTGQASINPYGYDRIFTCTSNPLSGSAWTQTYNGGTVNNNSLTSAVFAKGLFVVSNYGYPLYSATGSSWQSGYVTAGENTYVAFYNGVFAIGRTFGSLKYSTDGINYVNRDYNEQQAKGLTDEFIRCMSATDNGIIAIGSANAMWSPNGKEWYHIGPVSSGESPGGVEMVNGSLLLGTTTGGNGKIYKWTVQPDSFVLPNIPSVYAGGGKNFNAYMKVA